MFISLTSILILPTDWAASVWKNTCSRDRSCDFRERLDDADLVVGGHDGDQHRLVGDRRPELVQIDEAVLWTGR